METFSIQLDSFFRWKQKEPQLYYATILKYCPQFWEAPLPIIQRFSDKWSFLLFLVFQPIHSRTQFKWSACMKSGFSLIFYFAVPKKEKKKNPSLFKCVIDFKKAVEQNGWKVANKEFSWLKIFLDTRICSFKTSLIIADCFLELLCILDIFAVYLK